MIETFRKKPVEIGAIQFTGTVESASEIIDWVLAGDGQAFYRCNSDETCEHGPENHHLLIRTLEGLMAARAGWWVIRGIKGEFYPCEDEIFRGSYERTDGGAV